MGVVSYLQIQQRETCWTPYSTLSHQYIDSASKSSSCSSMTSWLSATSNITKIPGVRLQAWVCWLPRLPANTQYERAHVLSWERLLGCCKKSWPTKCLTCLQIFERCIWCCEALSYVRLRGMHRKDRAAASDINKALPISWEQVESLSLTSCNNTNCWMQGSWYQH